MAIQINTFRRREKFFGEGRCLPLDREAKVRIMARARALSHPTEKGKHYGVLTAKFLAVLKSLLWDFHNAGTGRCFPSYERIAEKARCNRDTVSKAIKALELAGCLTWVNRIVRIRAWGPDLFGRAMNRWRVIRTSNAYTFADPNPGAKPPKSSKSEIPTGTEDQESKLLLGDVAKHEFDPDNPLHRALNRLSTAVEGEKKGLSR